MDVLTRTSPDDDRTVVIVSGEVDVYTGPRLRAGIADAVEAGHRHLVVDLTGVNFLDSTGLGVLVGGLQLARDRGGSLVLVCVDARTLTLLRLTGLDELFPVHPTVDAALAVRPTA